jgi:hypothetical protein
MERELFVLLLGVLDQLKAARRRARRCQYTDHDVVAVWLWAVLHDRPVAWACARVNWPSHDRVRALPSGATMSRRLRSVSVRAVLEQMLVALNAACVDGPLILDAKALPIAWHSADPDAGVGRGAGQLSKGYKLHVIVDLAGNLRACVVRSLKMSEHRAVALLLDQLDPGESRCVLADGGYDSNRLYDLVGARGMRLLAARRYRHARGIGHVRHSPHRLEALRRMELDPSCLHPRRRVEGCFGTMGNVCAGLNGLPNWVRREHRVERWVLTKLIIDAAHRRQRTARRSA